MTGPSTIIWTDVNLMPEAREIIERHGWRIERQAEGLLDGVECASAIIAGSLLKGDATLFASAPALQVIARCGIGHDRIDLKAATQAGVCAINTPEAPTESTAEFAIALMLAVSRKLTTGAAALGKGEWISGAAVVGSDLEGKILGLVGCGRVGRRVGEIAQAFRMDVQTYDPFATSIPSGIRRALTLDELLASSDIVSLHLPLTPGTRQIIDEPTLARFKHGAILVNTSRGPLVDETALHRALESGHLRGAGIDVWDPEPPSADNPLLGATGVIATPHMAAFTLEGRRRSHATAAIQVAQVLTGEQPGLLLNPEVWPRRRSFRV